MDQKDILSTILAVFKANNVNEKKPKLSNPSICYIGHKKVQLLVFLKA